MTLVDRIENLHKDENGEGDDWYDSYSQARYLKVAMRLKELGMSEDQACNRIEVARRAREFPILLAAIEDGRLTVTAIRLLAPRLNPTNVEDLVRASHLKKTGLQALIANRFPQSEALRLDDGVIALGAI